MNLLTQIEQLSKNCLFFDNRDVWLDGLNDEIKALFIQGDQLKLREIIAAQKLFADTVEVVQIHD